MIFNVTVKMKHPWKSTGYRYKTVTVFASTPELAKQMVEEQLRIEGINGKIIRVKERFSIWKDT